MTDEQRQNVADYLATIEEIVAVITANSQDVGANTIVAARTALEGNVIMTSAAFEIFERLPAVFGLCSIFGFFVARRCTIFRRCFCLSVLR